MSIPFRLLIPRSHYDAMVAQAKAELPNECCGLLAGLIEETTTSSIEGPHALVGRVLVRYPLVNNAASPKEYLANDRTLFDAFRDIHARGFEVLAIYHSHPVSDPVPSRKDLERNYYDSAMHLIISLKAGQPEMRAWWLEGTDYCQADWQTVADG